MGGARHSDVRFRCIDRYVAAGNLDDNGTTNYLATTPVFGVLWRAASCARPYANWVANSRPGLRPEASRSRNAKVGLKLRPSERTEAGRAVFRADSDNELAVATNLGGRTTYQNISRRQGIEAPSRTSRRGTSTSPRRTCTCRRVSARPSLPACRQVAPHRRRPYR
jgi:iron complex outermembrane receptor protein